MKKKIWILGEKKDKWRLKDKMFTEEVKAQNQKSKKEKPDLDQDSLKEISSWNA